MNASAGLPIDLKLKIICYSLWTQDIIEYTEKTVAGNSNNISKMVVRRG